jgi:hypothetical protein
VAIGAVKLHNQLPLAAACHRLRRDLVLTHYFRFARRSG